MSAPWEDFLMMVAQMRECQKAYFRVRAPSSLGAAKKCEAAVDAFIKEKRAEWARDIQQELPMGGKQ